VAGIRVAAAGARAGEADRADFRATAIRSASAARAASAGCVLGAGDARHAGQVARRPGGRQLRQFDIGWRIRCHCAGAAHLANILSAANSRAAGGDAWITSQTLLARKQFLERVLRVDEARMAPPPRVELP